ncbi:MAG: PhzF family phenazine biosynthesis protein [Flavobacteriales bacterium]|nr:PhzF family phenazine biosynthesis protein [Flavobacteriales bacterium]
MHEINSFQLLNVFTGEKARGNSCCVFFTNDLGDSKKLLEIAQNFNQPATSFVKMRSEGVYDIRWFAPESEIDLCGHGALAATQVLLDIQAQRDEVTFHYKGGELTGLRVGERVSILGDLISCSESTVPQWLKDGFGEDVSGYFPSANKHIVLMKDPERIAALQPNWEPLLASGVFSFAVTAEGREVDFISRVFLPSLNHKEDQATGSAHMVLAPFWSKRLGKTTLDAHQVSARGGRMKCVVSTQQVQLIAACSYFGEGRLIN